MLLIFSQEEEKAIKMIWYRSLIQGHFTAVNKAHGVSKQTCKGLLGVTQYKDNTSLASIHH